jgi:hypothetical protein
MLEFRRPGLVTLLAVLDLLGGGLALLSALWVGVAGVAGKHGADAILIVAAVALFAVIAFLQIAAGVGLWQLKGWGRLLHMALACIGLLFLPCGTLISVLVLVYLSRAGVKVLFSGKTTQELLPEEQAALTAVLQGSTLTTALIAILMLLGGVGMTGIIAAFAIPAFLSGRVAANEAATIGRLRTVVSAEAVYAANNGGLVDTPACLRAPTSCNPGAKSATPLLDDSVVFDAPASGYVLTFHPGPAATGEPGRRVSPSSLQSFAVTAEPAVPNQTGVRRFCADNTGRVCTFTSPSSTEGQEGACSASCREAR